MRKIKLVTAVALAAILGIWFVALWRPSTHHLAAANSALSAAQDDQSSAISAEDQVKKRVKLLPAEEAKAAQLTAAVPSTPEVDVLLDQVGAIATEAGVGWQSESQSFAGKSASTASTSTGAPAGLETMSLTLAVSGTPAQVVHFVTLLQASPRVIQVSGVDLTDGGAPLVGPSIPATAGASTVATALAPTSLTATLYVDPSPLPAAPKLAAARQ